MYKSYSYNDMPSAVNTTVKPPPSKSPPEKKAACESAPEPKSISVGRLQSDDLILLVIIILLLVNDCNDKLLLLALAYVFFSDYFD